MTLASLALIGATIIFSSFVSGVFGMAGGMVLLGVLLVYFDVATGMVLFSLIQLATNGWRALTWRRYVIWPILYYYVAGALIAFAAMPFIAFVPNQDDGLSRARVMPFVVEVLPASWRPNIEWRGVPFVTGVLTTIVQFLAGVGGLFLDVFFQKSKLDRKTTNATKAITQTFSHVLRATHFGSLAGSGEFTVTIWAPAMVLAIFGAAPAPYVVERMTDHSFRQWTRAIIFAIAIVYLARAGWLMWQGTGY